VLTGFPSWPGLLWQAYKLAEAANVVILPTVVRPGGRVDIVHHEGCRRQWLNSGPCRAENWATVV